MRILTVDDSATMRRILRNTLHQAGYEDIIEAENGESALNKLKFNKIDFIITDWSMPEMNGIDFVLEIRRNPNYKHIPVLMITTIAEKNEILTALQAGVDNYIVKPFDTATLKAKMEQIVSSLQ